MNGKSEFVPRDQVFSLLVVYCSLVSTPKLVVSRNFLSIRIALSCFYLLFSIFRNSQLGSDVCRLSYMWSKGAFLGGNPKTDFAVFWVNPKTDHESIKSTLRWILQIKSKSGFLKFTIWAFFWERIWKKYFWQAVCGKKNGTQQMPYMYDILTEPMLVAPY